MTNLVVAAGLGYAFLGALIMYLSHRAIYRRARSIVAGYPRELVALRAQRHDGRFGLLVLLCGNILQVLAACGYSVAFTEWRLPLFVAVGMVVTYATLRILLVFLGTRSDRKRERAPSVERKYQTRRSMRLLQAARLEAAKRLAIEQAKDPYDRSVVYLEPEWECLWWSDKLGVPPDVLRAAVRQVGPMLDDIERYLSMRSRKGYALAA
jgi:hypothetical protein